jgi:redox-sensitive bicupin YhaK (pirin superfamily)
VAAIRVCVAGITGWTGRPVADAVEAAPDLELVAGVFRSDQESFSSVAEALDAAPADVLVRHDGDAIVRALVGEGSPVELGTPSLILDVELPNGGSFTSPIPSDFNAFVYMLEGEATFGGRRASRSQIALLGPGDALAVEEAAPGTRFVLMAGKPCGETPIFNGPFVD